jgi:hypothetical protein
MREACHFGLVADFLKTRPDFFIEVVARYLAPVETQPYALPLLLCRLLRLLPFSYSNLPLLCSVVIGSHGAEETPPPRS